MDTSLYSKSKLSYERSFDDTVDRNPLLFRLHSYYSSQTFFHPEEKVLVASRHSKRLKDSSREELSLRLTALEEAPSSLTLEKDSEAVEKHITSWKNKYEEPSRFISLTSNVLYVFWEWKRRMFSSYQDDFIIIVLKSSELRASGRTKLGTELLRRKENKVAFRFADHHEEVIVAEKIESKAILGFISVSRFENFIQSRCQKLLELGKKIPGSEKKLRFRDSLPLQVDKVDCARARESLCFALALLAPMFVPSEQRTDTGSVVSCSPIEQSRAEGVSPKVDPRSGCETMSGQSVAEDGGIPASCRERSHLLETGSQPAGTTGDRRLSEEIQPRGRLENEGPEDEERDGQPSVERLKWESKCVGILATEVCRVREKGRNECLDLCTSHGRELLKRYRTAMLRDSGEEPHEKLGKIMDEYKDWDKGTDWLIARD